MSHGPGGPCLLALVLLWTCSTFPTLGWISLHVPMGTTGVHDGAGVDGRLPVPVTDGIFSTFGLLIAPVLIALAPVPPVGGPDGPPAWRPASSTRDPPRRSARP